jgi:hypothetical protein
MKIKVWVSVLVFSFFVCTGNLAAQDRRGAELVIQKLDRQRIEGELIAVRQNSLLLLSFDGTDVSVDIKDINVIIIVKKSQARMGAIGGFLIGVAVGGYFGSRAEELKDKFSAISWGMIVGAIYGVGLGVVLGTDKTIKIEGKSDAEIKKVLEKLRRQARITNAK